ncbi:hypothetical protein CEB3_c46620 [Peptococcaceae bacterium CEB3]|nr:hypothetical protein CEB3_c46620 [Peptococcaceae bacterium CEB3]
MNRILFPVICVIFLLVSGCNSTSDSTGKKINTVKTQMNISSESEGKRIITKNNAADLVKIPNKILYYHQGKSTVIPNNDPRFNNLINMTKARLDGSIDIYKSVITLSDVSAQKEKTDLLEFVYDNNVEVFWKPHANGQTQYQYRLVYNSLIFPLDGTRRDWLIVLPIQNGPLGPLKSPDELLKYLNT